MIYFKKVVISALMLTAITAVAQEPQTKTEAQKVKDSVKMDVRNIGKITTTSTTITTRKGRRKKQKETIKPVADSLIVKDTFTGKNDSMPVIEADTLKRQ